MDREETRHRVTLSPDPGAPRSEGEGREVLDSRRAKRRETSHETWPRESTRERRAWRPWSEQPGVSRVRDTEVECNEDFGGERQDRMMFHMRRTEERALRTPVRSSRRRSQSADSVGHEDLREKSSSWNRLRHEDERDSHSNSRRERKRSWSSTRGDGEQPTSSNSKRFKHLDPTNNILDKFLSVLQSIKSSDKPKLSFNTNIVPEFDPMSKEQTILTWLTKVEECAEIYGWDDRETIHYALPKLTGVAKSWYQNLPNMMFKWNEWKRKLIESFPVREDYAELLTEMLAKRVKYSESPEHYYYAKINLLNRCKIHGRQAVECILYGVEDRAIKVGAQAAQFSEPEQVLKYFRTVKVGNNRENRDSNSSFRDDRKNAAHTTKSGSLLKITCYNCDQVGHPSFKCEKPAVKCTICEKLGHLSIHCFKNKRPNKDHEKGNNQSTSMKEQQVAQLNVAEELTAKYMINIKVNGHVLGCHLDLGSQCSLIKLSKAKELSLDIVMPEDLPVLRGIGANLISPVGMTIVDIEVQGLAETINLYVVDDYVIKQSVLLGHSFTEKPDIVITKAAFPPEMCDGNVSCEDV
ncbi:hypothetical protein HW555_012044 [Spodoptera exigua]|uniref:CCHC-type domain-containing protein n=1 Tax=Spodoptera exigua TaxID=7107 RepID=A0A835G7V7_SPOEX|nr:hypothetical protein HW555_012044 [Spodoptera exigua]